MTLTIQVINDGSQTSKWPQEPIILPDLTQLQVNRVIMVWVHWMDANIGALRHVRIIVTDTPPDARD